MKKQVFRVGSDGFNGAWYPAPGGSSGGLIIMLGDSSEDRMAKTGAKWLNEQGIHVMAMSPDKKDYGHHNYPLERFGKAIAFMKAQGCEKLGVVGASTTGMRRFRDEPFIQHLKAHRPQSREGQLSSSRGELRGIQTGLLQCAKEV